MMKFCSKTTEPYGVPTLVSLNTIMVDGTGMCGGCRVMVDGVARVRLRGRPRVRRPPRRLRRHDAAAGDVPSPRRRRASQRYREDDPSCTPAARDRRGVSESEPAEPRPDERA